jgi:hypothetical protein
MPQQILLFTVAKNLDIFPKDPVKLNTGSGKAIDLPVLTFLTFIKEMQNGSK